MSDILNWTRSFLATTPARWASLIENVPDELLSNRPAAGEWSALECLQHLIDAERWVFPSRILAFLAEEDFALLRIQHEFPFSGHGINSTGCNEDESEENEEVNGEFVFCHFSLIKALRLNRDLFAHFK